MFNDGSQNYSFSRSEYVSAKSSAAYTYYRDTATGATLKLLNQVPTNPVIALTYVTYGKWSPVAQSPIVLNDNYVVFGSMTSGRERAAQRLGVLPFRPRRHLSAERIADGQQDLFAERQWPAERQLCDGHHGNHLHADCNEHRQRLQDPVRDPDRRRLHRRQHLELERHQPNWAADGTKTLFSAVGNFHGPQASEIGAAFTLTQTLGTATVGAGAGALVGKKN